jgi:hypothetical protein
MRLGVNLGVRRRLRRRSCSPLLGMEVWCQIVCGWGKRVGTGGVKCSGRDSGISRCNRKILSEQWKNWWSINRLVNELGARLSRRHQDRCGLRAGSRRQVGSRRIHLPPQLPNTSLKLGYFISFLRLGASELTEQPTFDVVRPVFQGKKVLDRPVLPLLETTRDGEQEFRERRLLRGG